MSVLSQNEIDQILGGTGGASSGGAGAAPAVHVYDFRRPHRVSRERLRSLEAMYERFAKSLEGWLIARIRGQISLQLISVEQLSFGEFVLSLPTPCSSFLYDIEDSGGQQGVIDFGREFSYFLVDRLFGGTGTGVAPERPLSGVEQMAVRVKADRVAHVLMDVWRDHVELRLGYAGFEAVPDILQAVGRDDPVLVANIEVRFAGKSSLMLICLPFTSVEKFFSSSHQRRVNQGLGTDVEREASRELAERSLRATRLTVEARLPDFPLTLGDFSALKVGDLLSTGVPIDSEISLVIRGQKRFRASAARVGRRLAVRIVEPVAPVADEEDASSHEQDG